MPVTPLDATGDVVSLTEAICNISSVSGDERALADAIEQVLTSQPHLEVIRDGDAIVARTNFGRATRVVIAGHIDVVPVADNLPVRRVVIDGEDSLWGRGTVDMKGGVAVQLKLACELTSPKMDVTWIFYDHEEVDVSLNGLGRLSRNHPELIRGDFAVLCEPTAAVIEGGCNGTMRVAVTTSGVKAHSARPWMGKNAIHGLTEVLARLSSNEPETVSVEGLDYRESLNAVMVSGGIASNVIPDSATVTVNYRFAPSKSVADAESYLRSFFEGFEVEVIDAAAGARPGLDRPAAKA
ncbi:MAG: succinyl-diaminopimelate desuccinylase, partial [Rhodoluna sp.]|nr:succinyl-diaminopimelate desuccinylase [Rhodoluna sp.]